MNFIIAGLAIIYLSICGFGLIKLILRGKIAFSVFGIIPLSFGAGLGLLAVLSNLIMLAGFHLSFVSLYAPLSLFFLYALTQIKAARTFKPGMLLDGVRGISLKEWSLILVIAFGVISILTLSLIFPLHFWDSRANWGTPAKMLFYSGTTFSSDFTDIERVPPHSRYPLLFPVSQTFIYFALGNADDWAVMLLISLFFPFMIFFLYDLARIFLQDREKALAASAMIAVLPVFFTSDGPAYSGYADTPLAMLYLLSFGMTLLWKRNKDIGYLALSAFLSSILLLTKNEGFILLILNLLLIVLPDNLSFNIKKKDIANAVKLTFMYAAIIIFTVAPWQILAKYLAMDTGTINSFQSLHMKNLVGGLTNIPMIANFTISAFAGIGKNMFGYGFSWAGLWSIFLITTALSVIHKLMIGLHFSLIVLADVILITMMYAMLSSISNVQIVSTLKALENKKD